MRILAIVEYDGTSYAGWQYQLNQISVQETIERAISQIRNQPTKIYGSGRTDAGVHAYGQTFHFDIEVPRDLENFRHSINCVLPNDIHVKSLTYVKDDFHARLSAVEKTYEYVINLHEPSAFNYKYETLVDEPLDIEEMEKAAKIFVGTHCFQNFTTKEEDEDNFVRTISKIEFIKENNQLIIRFTGDGFMRYMIRLLVGALIQVGRHKITVEHLQNVLNSSTRLPVSYKAEAKGLYLVEVKYN